MHRMAGRLTITLTGIAIIPFVVGRTRRKGDRMLLCVPHPLGVLCVLGFSLGFSGCGKDQFIISTPRQNYSFAVPAIANNAGLSNQTAIVLTVEH